MAVLFKRALLLAALVPSLAEAAPSGGLQPAPAAEIAAAVGDCWNAVGPAAVDRAKLQARGWKSGSLSSPGGAPVFTPLRFYSKSGSTVLILLGDADGMRSMCTVMSAVPAAQTIERTAGAIQRALLAVDPTVKAARSQDSIVFLALPRIAMVDSTGTKDKPATRIAVRYQAAEKK